MAENEKTVYYHPDEGLRNMEEPYQTAIKASTLKMLLKAGGGLLHALSGMFRATAFAGTAGSLSATFCKAFGGRKRKTPSIEKVYAIGDYFRAEFPGKVVKYCFEASLQVYLFYLSGERRGIVIGQRFLEVNSASSISKHLEQAGLSKLLQQGSSQILVGNDGQLIIL